MFAVRNFIKTSPSFVQRRAFSTESKGFNVTILGAAGGIGSSLSTMLKCAPSIASLRLHDLNPAVVGIGVDISHINTSARVNGYVGKEQLKDALSGANIVVIPAGVARKPGMTRDDLFNTNATIIKDLAEASAAYCPQAFILIITNPVNSTVPIYAETLKKAGVYDKKRVFGVTTLDSVRASTFVSEIRPQFNPENVHVKVIGGHSGITILPLLSRLAPKNPFTQEEIDKLTHRIQYAGDEVVKAKGTGSATLSMAYAASNFTNSVIRALSGNTVVETAYVESTIVPGTPYFASSFELTKDGVSKILPLDPLSAFEQKQFEALIPELNKNIEAGVKFVNK